MISLSGADAYDVYFWGVHGQGELDLLIHHRGKRLGFEIKYSDHPGGTASHRLALDALSLDRLTIVCPGSSSYPLDEKIGVRGLLDVMDHPETLWTGW